MRGTVVENECIISVRAIVDYDMEIKNVAISMPCNRKGAGQIERFRKWEARDAILGYKSAVIKYVRLQR